MSDPAHETEDVDALFVPDGLRLVPTDRAGGPWSPDSLHGGPVAAVVARETERSAPVDDGLRMTRLTLELLRPVGTAPLTVTGVVARPGRRVQVIDTVVEQGGVEVAWGRAVRNEEGVDVVRLVGRAAHGRDASGGAPVRARLPSVRHRPDGPQGRHPDRPSPDQT